MPQSIEQWKQKVLACIDEQELTDLILALSNIHSPFPYEKEAGDYVYDWMKKEGFNPKRVGMTEDRFSVIGKLKGEGNGYNLLFSSHLDVTGPRGHVTDSWRFTPENMENPWWRTAELVDGRFYGQGVNNDKGPMACFLIAAKALKLAGAPLKGDIYLTACPGEMGQEPVSEFQGPFFHNKDIGAEYMMKHGGIIADYGVAAEGTDFKVGWVEAGKTFFKITVTGSWEYTAWASHPEVFQDHPNAIIKAIPLIEALERFARDYEKKHTVHLPGGTVVPRVQIGAIRGGAPFYITSGCERCELYIDVRIAPGMVPGDVYRELQQVVKESGVEADIELFLFRQGYEADAQKIQPLVAALEKSHTAIFNSRLEMVEPKFTSMWRDHNVFNEYNIASLTYGPIRFDPTVENMVETARIYALLALEIGWMERSQ